MSKKIKTDELFDCKTKYLLPLFLQSEYPWDMIPKIKEYILDLINEGIDGFAEIADGVLVGSNVKIYPTSTIEGPTVIGSGSEIRPGAFIRGGVITGENCVIGNSSELKNCILLENVQVPHYNYVGDSILGNKAHMGAGSICSNLKSDGKNVVVHGEKEYVTGLRKLGAILGDGADIGCGCVLNPGTVIGKGTSVYPLTCIRGVIDEFSIVKSSENIVKKEK